MVEEDGVPHEEVELPPEGAAAPQGALGDNPDLAEAIRKEGRDKARIGKEAPPDNHTLGFSDIDHLLNNTHIFQLSALIPASPGTFATKTPKAQRYGNMETR